MELFIVSVKCNSPPELANGSYEGVLQTTYHEGDEVLYTCRTSSDLPTQPRSTNRTTTCMLTGNWEPDPQCDP